MLEALQSFSAKAKKNKSQNELRGMRSGGSGILTHGVKIRAGSGTLFGAGILPVDSIDSGLSSIYRFPQKTQTPQVA